MHYLGPPFSGGGKGREPLSSKASRVFCVLRDSSGSRRPLRGRGRNGASPCPARLRGLFPRPWRVGGNESQLPRWASGNYWGKPVLRRAKRDYFKSDEVIEMPSRGEKGRFPGGIPGSEKPAKPYFMNEFAIFGAVDNSEKMQYLGPPFSGGGKGRGPLPSKASRAFFVLRDSSGSRRGV